MPAGEVHTPGDVLDLARCIEKVLRDGALAAEYGLAGHTRVSQQYQSHHMAAAHESLYHESLYHESLYKDKQR